MPSVEFVVRNVTGSSTGAFVEPGYFECSSVVPFGNRTGRTTLTASVGFVKTIKCLKDVGFLLSSIFLAGYAASSFLKRP